MNRFFVSNNIYKDRIAICKSCEHYQSLLGNCAICKCFMKVKARLGPSECADNPRKWEKTKEVKTPKDLPDEMVKEAKRIWQLIQKGRAPNTSVKSDMIELYNTIHNTNYSTTTNCSSCLSVCFDSIKKINREYE